jgi:hypothetical protein
MADDVSITFAAQIGQLISGVDQVKSAINSIAEPVNALAGLFTGFGEAFAGAFAIDQVAAFASQMEELGTNTLRTSAMLGVSTAEAQQLGFIAKATGGSSEELATAMERLQVNLQKAQSGAGPAAQALQALGLSARSLIGLPLEEQLNKIADAVSKFADGGNKTAIVMDLLGRSGAQMIPMLDQGSAGMQRLREAAENAGVIVSKQTSVALDQAGTSSTILKASITALGESIVAAFTPQIIEASNSLTGFVSDLSALVQTGQFSRAAMDALGASLRIVAANFENLAVVASDVLTLSWTKATAEWKAGNDQIREIQQQSDDQLVAQALLARGQLQNILAAENVSSTKPQAPALAVPNKQAISAAQEEAQAEIKAAQESYQSQVTTLKALQKEHLITEQQMTAETIAAVNAREDEQLAALNKEEQTVGLSAVQYVKIESEKTQIIMKAIADRQKALDHAQQEEIKSWNSALQPLESAFNSQLQKMLSGGETFGQGMQKIFANLVTQIIEELMKLALEEAVVFAVTGSFGNVGGLGTGIVGGIGKILGFDEGTNLVTQSGLAVIHQGESIVPAQGSGPYSPGGGGSGGGMTFAPNFSGFIGTQAMINSILPQLARGLQGYQNLNPSTMT